MFNVLIDTCVWLDLAQDQKQTPLLLVVENMAKAGLLRLLVPRIEPPRLSWRPFGLSAGR